MVGAVRVRVLRGKDIPVRGHHVCSLAGSHYCPGPPEKDILQRCAGPEVLFDEGFPVCQILSSVGEMWLLSIEYFFPSENRLFGFEYPVAGELGCWFRGGWTSYLGPLGAYNSCVSDPLTDWRGSHGTVMSRNHHHVALGMAISADAGVGVNS